MASRPEPASPPLRPIVVAPAAPEPPAAPVPAQAPAEKWSLVWHDEFDGAAIDTGKWSHIVAGGGFGNNERQFYTDQPRNSFIENSCLVIQALQEERDGHPYTSAKLVTQGKAQWTYGRIEVRAKVPVGQGFWPAVWLMPADYQKYGPWPSCGEIDLLETVGYEPDAVFGTLHYGNPWKNSGSHFRLPDGERFADDFHVFTLEWAPGKFEWLVDGVSYGTQTDWYTSAPGAMWPAPFDRDFYLQVNLAVGGNWPGYPDATTPFPGRFLIDYIRVFKFNGRYPPVEQRPAAPPDLRPRDPMPDGNLVYNGDFGDGLSHWTHEVHERAKAAVSVENGALVFDVQEAGSEAWHAQLLHHPLNIQRGQSYAIEFDASSRVPASVNVRVGKASQHWDNYSGDLPVSIGPTMKRQRVTFRMRHETDPVARLEIQLGKADGKTIIDNVSVKPIPENVPMSLSRRLTVDATQSDASQGVQAQPCAEGGLNVGWIESGDWLEYQVRADNPGMYLVRVRFANGGKTAGRLALLVNSSFAAQLDLPVTGDWQKWQTAQALLHIPKGDIAFRAECRQTGFNLKSFEFEAR